MYRSSRSLRLFPLLLLLLLAAGSGGGGGGMRVREPVLAGAWYPADPAALAGEIVSLYQAARPYSPEDLPGEPFAFIVPHAGYRFSGRTAATVFQVLKGRKISRVILLAFPHRHRLDRLALPPFEAWETPIGRIEVDREAAEALRRSDLVTEMPQIDRDEHSAEIEIPLLTAVLGGETRLLPLYVGDLSNEMLLRCARLLRPYLDEGSVIVASSDFTHYGKRYGFVPFPPDERVEARLRALDLGAVAAIQSLDPGRFLGYLQETGATVCGRNPIRLLLAILALDRDRVAIEPRLLDYETSGHLTGDWTFSVGYVGMLFGRRKGRILDRPLEEKEREILLDLARRSLESVVRKGYPLILDARGGTRWEIPLRLHKVQGAFVTLWKGEQLRGCMGNVVPVSPLYQAVIDMAATAARKDPRFPPVRPEELGEIHIEVSVLSPFEAIETPSLIEIGKHGVLLRKGKYQAIFLPDVAPRQGWDRKTLLRRLCRKAGLPPDAWREKDARLYRFTAEAFEEAHPPRKTAH